MNRMRWRAIGTIALVVPWLSGCVTLAEFRKLEYEVNRLKGEGLQASGDPVVVADLNADVEALRVELAELRGRVEVAEHRAEEALGEARNARQDAAGGEGASDASAEPAGSPEEVKAYREAHAAWRAGDLDTCVALFRDFLQTYPSSDHADDAGYWLADCHFKQQDYKNAILRFDDVVRRYPSGDKAPEALYRQGEALLRLGPEYGQAARKAFQTLIDEYPESARVADAREQLDLLGPG